jgi:lysophospholipase L1-like esterase
MTSLIRLSLISLLFFSCENQSEQPQPEAATIQLKYVSVGSSFTAGFMSGGLYRESQLGSYPSLIAKQMKVDFVQPLFSTGQENGTGYMKAVSLLPALTTQSINEQTAIRSSNPLLFTKFSGSINNLGIGNMRMKDVGTSGYGNPSKTDFNPHFERLLAVGQEDKNYLDFVKDTKPNLYTVMLGDDDIAQYALSGGRKTVTDIMVFSQNTRLLLDALVSTQAKGIVATLPDILDFPYFNYHTLESLKGKNGLGNDIYIITNNGITRKATNKDFFTFDSFKRIENTAKTGVPDGQNTNKPLATEYVIDENEANQIRFKINEFNAILKKEATERQIPILDLNLVFQNLKDKKYGDGSINYSFPSGNLFSLDGYHPTAKGYAIIANEFIKSLNENHKNLLKTTITSLDVAKFEGLK